jgi:hypothetical protein
VVRVVCGGAVLALLRIGQVVQLGGSIPVVRAQASVAVFVLVIAFEVRRLLLVIVPTSQKANLTYL